jgi:hypothetical protein
MLPMEWDKSQDMFRYLNSLAWGYQLNMEKRMFATAGAEYRASLIRWDNNGITRDNKRVVLLETSDPKQLEAALLMLINEAETQRRIAGERISIVP